MFGRLAIEYNGEVVLESDGGVQKLWNLLAYLISNKNRTISSEELQEMLFADGRSSNPQNALKNLIYRLRKMLDESKLPKADYIIQNGRSYAWNKSIAAEIDTDEFIRAYEGARFAYNSNIALDCYEKVIKVYTGSFLPMFQSENWAAVDAAKYERIFDEVIFALYKLAEKEGHLETMLPICERAININPYEERIYGIYINCLTKLKRSAEALKVYNYISNKLYMELGIEPSGEFKSLHKIITNDEEYEMSDLDEIHEDLIETEQALGCYFCDYSVFKDIYRLLARSIARSGEDIHLVLFTNIENDENITDAERVKAMEVLKECITNSFRTSDVFTRYSLSQYVALLPNTTYVNANMVAHRVTVAYSKRKISKTVPLKVMVRKMEPKLRFAKQNIE